MGAPSTLSDLQWELVLNAITAASASFAGAYGAWKIANRAERKKAVADEIAVCNRAVGLCGSIMNTILALRGQLLIPKFKNYREQFQKYAKASEAAWLGQPYEPLEMGMDLRTISIPYCPMEYLQTAIAGIRGNNQAPMLLAALRQSVESLSKSIERHNELTRLLRGNADGGNLYFGLFDGAGADESFPDAMRGLDVQSQDCLYYSDLLAAVITRYGTDLSKKFSRGWWKVSRLAPASARHKAMLPDPNDYAEEERIFRPKELETIPQEKRRWFQAHTEGYLQKALRSFGRLNLYLERGRTRFSNDSTKAKLYFRRCSSIQA